MNLFGRRSSRDWCPEYAAGSWQHSETRSSGQVHPDAKLSTSPVAWSRWDLWHTMLTLWRPLLSYGYSYNINTVPVTTPLGAELSALILRKHVGAVLWLPDVCRTCLHFFHFSAGFWILTVLIFTILVSSRHSACNERLIAVFWSLSTYRPRKFVTVSVLISGQLCAARWSVTPCLPTNPLSSTPQAKVVCRMSTVDRMCILVHHIHTVDLLPVLRPPGWPCNAGLVSCQRVWSVHCSQPTRTASACLSLIHIWRCRRIERCRSRWSPYH